MEDDIFNLERLAEDTYRLKRIENQVSEEISSFDETQANTFNLTYARHISKTEEQLRETQSRELDHIFEYGQFQGYDLYARLGEGGVGMVWLAGKDGESYALKVPKTEYDAKAIELEIEILAIKLMQNLNLPESHSKIIAFKDSFERSFAAEYLAGKIKLLKKSSENGTKIFKNVMQPDQLGINSVEVAKILLDVLDAEDYIHSMGIIHRDIKWENLLFTKPYDIIKGNRTTKTRTTKLFDFGAAFNLNWLDDPKEFNEKYIEFWTPHTVGVNYIEELEKLGGDFKGNPPSKEKAKEIFITREDFANGAMLYHLLTGRRPYQDENGINYIDKHKDLNHVHIIKQFEPFNYDLLSQVQNGDFWIKVINMLCNKEKIKRSSTRKNLHDRIRHMIKKHPDFSYLVA